MEERWTIYGLWVEQLQPQPWTALEIVLSVTKRDLPGQDLSRANPLPTSSRPCSPSGRPVNSYISRDGSREGEQRGDDSGAAQVSKAQSLALGSGLTSVAALSALRNNLQEPSPVPTALPPLPSVKAKTLKFQWLNLLVSCSLLVKQTNDWLV